MKNDSTKWVLAGVAGALLAVGAFAAVGIFIFTRLSERFPESMDFSVSDVELAEEEDVLSGPEQWRQEEERFNEEQAGSEANIRNRGLDGRYTIVAYYEDLRTPLYEARDFATVEQRLGERLAAAVTPLERHRYTTLMLSLSDLKYNEDPERQRETLDGWVAHSPESHYPLLVRAGFYIEYAWFFRGENYAAEVPEQDMSRYHELHNLAWEDLLKARALNSTDPEIPYTLTRAAAGQPDAIAGEDTLEVMWRHFEETVALNPHHLNVRGILLNYAQPRWFGSWEEMDKVVKDIEAAQVDFPIMNAHLREAARMMQDRSRIHERRYNSGQAERDLLEHYALQLAQSPGDLPLLYFAARVALNASDYETSHAYFTEIGDRYLLDSGRFPTLWNFHWTRMHVMTHLSTLPGVKDTPREKELLDAATAVEPESPMVSCLYLDMLARKQDDALTRAWFASQKDPYLMTGNVAEGPNYAVIRAMSLAGRSDEYYARGQDEEVELLKQAMLLGPENAFVRLVQAEYHISNDEFEEARKHLEHARQLDPNYLPALHIMGWLSFHEKKWDDGIRYAQEFLATPPSYYLKLYTDDAKEIIQLCEEKKAKEAEETKAEE